MIPPLRIAIIGGGPGGLYLAGLLKRRQPALDVRVYERNAPDVTFGFGVVFSDATLEEIRAADPETCDAITARFAHWDDIDVHVRGRLLRSTGHGFSGLSRHGLNRVLQDQARARGVELHFGVDVDPANLVDLQADLVVAADGVNSRIRTHFAEHFQPRIVEEPNRFVWLGTTRRFPAFTFYFKEDAHGLWRVHAYNYDQDHSTFIVECTDATWRAAGLDQASEAETRAFVEALFAEELAGHPILGNHSIWRRFPTISCGRWSHGNVALLGDAVHTAHFSVGSGTRLAMEGAIALADALVGALDGQGGLRPGEDVPGILARYEATHRPAVESLQRAAAVSRKWFEDTERLYHHLPPEQLAFSLLTRSLRITHSSLGVRDPDFVAATDAWFAQKAFEAAQIPAPVEPPPPMFTPLRLRGLTLRNRVVVSPMCQYKAVEGTPTDWHLVHLGSRATGGAGLVMAEMTDVSPEGRITPGCAGLYTDEHTATWRRIVDYVHQHTDAAIGIQLGHAGRKAATCVPWEGGDSQPLKSGSWPILAPSPLPYLPHSQVPRAMDRADMDRVRDAFVQATHRADEAGFDLIEIHMAHGYLLASYLSPITNRRTDEYGGNLANRLRFPLEVFTAVRAAWPAHKPMSVRLSATDWMPEGTTGEDAIAIARALADAGLDLIDVSTGQTDPAARPQYGRLYQTPFAEAIRLETGLATMTVGGISSYEDVNSILAAGRADLCALARVHLFDPYWTRHAAFEQHQDGAWPEPYAAMHGYIPRSEWSPRGRGR